VTSVLRFLRKTFELDSECRKVLGDGLPDDGQVDAEVLVNQDGPHPGDIRPGNVDWWGLLIRGQMPSGFADDLEIPYDGVNRLLISAKLVEIQSGDVVLDVGDRAENVLPREVANL